MMRRLLCPCRSFVSLIVRLLICQACSSSPSRSSDGNSSLLDEGGSASQVRQATLELPGYGSVVWLDSLSAWFVDGAGLHQTLCCLTASTCSRL